MPNDKIDEWKIPPLLIENKTVMTAAELKAWTQLGKNSVSDFIRQHDLKDISGNARNRKYSTLAIFRAVLKIVPGSPEEFHLLLKPLQRASWVSRTTGESVSALGKKARDAESSFPASVQLLRRRKGPDFPRDRRWIPAEIEALVEGRPPPFSQDATVQSSPVRAESAPITEFCG
ncbi:thioredoxin domain-containing protein [Mangrovicoccus ximenensis]|uniref:hypothetical protein n=1 Tax=Mangrovicoccus ximenensis TaxID=1911570 RepID=UPI0011AE6943|nr:hypothetical protein [Mangrovicoccus ximenensis]